MNCHKPILKVFTVAVLSAYLAACAQTQKQAELPQPSPEEIQKAKEIAAFKEAVEFHQAGDTKAAIRAYESLVVAFPENVEARVNLVLLRLKESELNEAAREELIALLDEALAIDPNHVQTLTVSGFLARESGDFEAAETFYRKALAIDGNYQPAILNLAILLDLYRGRLDEALALYEQVEPNEALPEQRLKDWLFDIKRRIGES